ncbi:HlyD family efflux transporter periplasmic adaptor subunit [Planktotalea arctica]|uniref:HlyD family efflux transporter periplasmic adaptor subunit n=1 Tax=Planktotalea arctica TaxID=1481893 RepID=UPI000A173C8B|nr:HlyD family efflux transporter periplasmic adaptor subunit [Planktotalea arctica]
MSKQDNEAAGKLPLQDNGIAKTSNAPARTSRLGHLYIIPLLMLTLFTGAVIGMYFQPPGLRVFFNATGLQPGAGSDMPIAIAVQKVSAQEEVAVISEGDVLALGRIIPRGDVINVATPSGAGDARIAALNVNVGDTVERRDILAELDNLPQLQSAIRTAQANVAVRDAALAQTRASIDASRAEAQASLSKAEAGATETDAELSRVTSLFERGVTTRAEMDRAIASANTAARDVERNIATLSRYAAGSDTVQADIAVAEANLTAAKAELARAEQDIERGYVRAPTKSTVLQIHAQPGERPSASGIIDLGDTSQMTIEAEVYQSMIARVTIGDPISASADALPQPLTGVVAAIGLEIGRQSITSDDPAANTDARVVDVIISLDADSSARARALTNLETIVRIDAGRIE